ncbi:MAG: hypothetical protein GTO08_10115, partial [Deltaproteobacteria bacterium]|nr:hypothetical protein [Deltaproteobacteria bacterium]
DIAAGFIRVADEKMAMAIKEISVSRGFDVREYSLVCFGGAGGQHACSIASLLDIQTIILHPLNSVMSAYGIGCAQPAFKAEQSVLKPYTIERHRELTDLFAGLEKQKPLSLNPSGDTQCSIKRLIDLRPQGTETWITIECSDFPETLAAFQDQYSRLFGFIPDTRSLEIVNIRIEMEESTVFFPPYHEKTGRPGTLPQP